MWTTEEKSKGQNTALPLTSLDSSASLSALPLSKNQPQDAPVGRFAPSPTGRIHAGNIYAALASWLIVKSLGGTMVLRIEDLDRERSKPLYSDAVQRDFSFLGLTWDKGPYFQHDRDDAYNAALEHLKAEGLVYRCFCTRAELHPASAPHRGEKFVYAGTCKNLTDADIELKLSSGKQGSLRLEVPDSTIAFTDEIQGFYRQNLAKECGDFLIRRADGAFAYQLAVVVDDGAQGVNSITRGVDLLCSTPQQIYLQHLLGLPTPTYAHIPLLVSVQDRRLSKRDHDASLDELLTRFKTPQAIIGYIAGLTGLAPTTDPAYPEDLLKEFSLDAFRSRIGNPIQTLWR